MLLFRSIGSLAVLFVKRIKWSKKIKKILIELCVCIYLKININQKLVGFVMDTIFQKRFEKLNGGILNVLLNIKLNIKLNLY